MTARKARAKAKTNAGSSQGRNDSQKGKGKGRLNRKRQLQRAFEVVAFLSSSWRPTHAPRAAHEWGTEVGVWSGFGDGGLAFLDVVLVPGGDFGDVGAGFFDDALAAKAAVELQTGGEFEAVQL
jgi:hypothetical protein